MVTNVKTETSQRITEWLAFEETNRYSRENITVAASQDLKNGQVIMLDGSGNAVAYAGGASDVAYGIVIEDVATAAGQTVRSAAVVRHARVVQANLIFKSGVSAAKKTEALTALAGKGITNAIAV